MTNERVEFHNRQNMKAFGSHRERQTAGTRVRAWDLAVPQMGRRNFRIQDRSSATDADLPVDLLAAWNATQPLNPASGCPTHTRTERLASTVNFDDPPPGAKVREYRKRCDKTGQG